MLNLRFVFELHCSGNPHQTHCLEYFSLLNRHTYCFTPFNQDALFSYFLHGVTSQRNKYTLHYVYVSHWVQKSGNAVERLFSHITAALKHVLTLYTL